MPAVATNPKQQQSKPEPVIRFQRFFKSMGTRTYAAQIKEAANGNPFLVLTDEGTPSWHGSTDGLERCPPR